MNESDVIYLLIYLFQPGGYGHAGAPSKRMQGPCKYYLYRPNFRILATTKIPRFRQGTNSRPPACEADVITTAKNVHKENVKYSLFLCRVQS